MRTYVPEFKEGKKELLLHYATSENSDIEDIFESILAYKKLLQKTICIATGQEIDLRRPVDEVKLSIKGYSKGSDIFQLLLEIVPPMMQNPIIIGVGVLLSGKTLLDMTNSMFDLYLKWQQLSVIPDMSERIRSAERLLEEHDLILDKMLQQENMGLIHCPTSALKALDYTVEELEAFTKPSRNGNAQYIDLSIENKRIFTFSPSNSGKLDMNFINEKTELTSKIVKFEQVNISNQKEWRVRFDDDTSVKAIIRHTEFFQIVDDLDDNVLKNSYLAEMLTHWTRKKGEPELSLSYVEVLNVDFQNPRDRGYLASPIESTQ